MAKFWLSMLTPLCLFVVAVGRSDIFPLSLREQSWISSDRYRALPDPVRAHSQDYQCGLEPASWWKAGICFLRWYSSGTSRSLFCRFFTTYSNWSSFLFSPSCVHSFPGRYLLQNGVFWALEVGILVHRTYLGPWQAKIGFLGFVFVFIFVWLRWKGKHW